MKKEETFGTFEAAKKEEVDPFAEILGGYESKPTVIAEITPKI